MNDFNLETGTTSFLDRYALTRRLEENLEYFLKEYGFTLLTFGHPVILRDNTWIKSKLKSIQYKANLSAIKVKFSPDYIVVKKNNKTVFFYLDAKASITPVYFDSQVQRIKINYHKDENLSQHDIGDIEREAWFSYNRFYKDVAIIIAVPYNPNLLLGEWVNKIECMWCLKKAQAGNPIPWDCNKCPIYSSDDRGFGVLVNEFAAGSGTPHTNIHLGSMRSLDKFLLEEFDIEVNKDDYAILLDFIKKWPLNKPAGTVNWKQFNNVIRKLRNRCPWLKFRIEDKMYSTYPGSLF